MRNGLENKAASLLVVFMDKTQKEITSSLMKNRRHGNSFFLAEKLGK